MHITAEISPGELLDKISILTIKLSRIADQTKLVNIHHEHDLLMAKYNALQLPSADIEKLTRLFNALTEINTVLWEIEDNIRDCEREGNFGPKFIELARSVYKSNDKRSELKRDINTVLQSKLVEEKSYKPY
jgi:hypothetical protein